MTRRTPASRSARRCGRSRNAPCRGRPSRIPRRQGGPRSRAGLRLGRGRCRCRGRRSCEAGGRSGSRREPAGRLPTDRWRCRTGPLRREPSRCGVFTRLPAKPKQSARCWSAEMRRMSGGRIDPLREVEKVAREEVGRVEHGVVQAVETCGAPGGVGRAARVERRERAMGRSAGSAGRGDAGSRAPGP
jgi:hypothetical protein